MEAGGGVDGGGAGFERLLHGAEGYAVEPFGLEVHPLGVVAEEGGDAVDADFDGLLDQPFEAGGVLGGGYGEMEEEGTGLVVVQPFHYLHFAASLVGDGDAGTAHGPVAGGDPQLVARRHAEDTDAVFRLVGRKDGIGAVGVVG